MGDVVEAVEADGWPVYDPTHHDMPIRAAMRDLERGVDALEVYDTLARVCGLTSRSAAWALLCAAREARRAQPPGRTQSASWYRANGYPVPVDIPDELPNAMPDPFVVYEELVEQIMAAGAASSRDIATRMVLRANVTGLHLDDAASIAKDVRKLVGVEIEDSTIPSIFGHLTPPGPRRRGRPSLQDWNRVVIALERLVRAARPDCGIPHKVVAAILLYFGPKLIAMLRAGTPDVVVLGDVLVTGVQAGLPMGSSIDIDRLERRLQEWVRDTWREHGP